MTEGKRSVDVWATPAGIYVRNPEGKRGHGPYPDLNVAVVAISEEVPFPFLVNMRDPVDVPESEWPITRKRKIEA